MATAQEIHGDCWYGERWCAVRTQPRSMAVRVRVPAAKKKIFFFNFFTNSKFEKIFIYFEMKCISMVMVRAAVYSERSQHYE